jgi:outer membrane protein TolC
MQRLVLLLLLMTTPSATLAAAASVETENQKKLNLSLEAAIELALKNNLRLQSSRRSLSQATSQYRAAKAQYYPTLQVGYNASQTNTKTAGVNDVGTIYASSAEINVDIPLDLSGTINRAVQQALIKLTISKANYVQESQGLVVTVYEQYYNVLSSSDTIKINKAQVSLAEDQLRIAQALLNGGRVPEVDVLTAKVQLNNEQQNLKASEGQYEISLANLKNTLLVDQESEIAVTSSIDYQPEYFDFQQAMSESLENRLEIKIQTLNVESAKIARRSTYDPYRPNLSITGNYGYAYSEDQFADAFVNYRLNDPVWAVTTRITIPLFIFDGGVIRETIKQASIGVQQAEANLKETKQSIELEIRNLLTSLENAQERVKIVQDTIELAKESLRITELRYRMGKTSYLELVNGRNNLRTAELNLLSAMIEHILSKIRVYRSLGRPLVN